MHADDQTLIPVSPVNRDFLTVLTGISVREVAA